MSPIQFVIVLVAVGLVALAVYRSRQKSPERHSEPPQHSRQELKPEPKFQGPRPFQNGVPDVTILKDASKAKIAQELASVGPLQVSLVYEPSKVSLLHREATENKGKDWDKAIDCLRKARDLMMDDALEYGVDRFLRLPLFLQQAGRMEEAVEEFNFLLEIPFHPHEIGKIYDKMRLAYQREKDYQNAVACASAYATIEFLNEEHRNAYFKRVIAPLYKKAEAQAKKEGQVDNR